MLVVKLVIQRLPKLVLLYAEVQGLVLVEITRRVQIMIYTIGLQQGVKLYNRV